MNVVVVVDSLDLSTGGGVGTFIYDLCYELSLRKNVKTYLVGIIKDQTENDPLRQQLIKQKVHVISLNACSRKDAIVHFLKYVNSFRVIIREISYGENTICNLHLKLGCLIGSYASLGLKNVYCVETYHNTYKNYLLQCWAMAPIIKKYICVSNAAMEEMHRRFCVPYKKLISIPNGVNRELIRAKVNAIDEQRNLSFIVISVGRLSYEKNILLSAKAFLFCSQTNE